jgi:hypothetical protein
MFTVACRSFVSSLAEGYRQRLQAALIKLVEEEDGSHEGQRNAAAAITRLTIASSSFGSRLDDGHRKRLQAALIRLLEDGHPCNQRDGALAFAYVTEANPSLLSSLDDGHRKRLQAALVKVVEEGLPAPQSCGALAIGQLTAASPSFGSSLDEGYRRRLQAALIKLVEEGIPCGKGHGALAIGELTEISPSFGSSLNEGHRQRLQAALIKLVEDGSQDGKSEGACAIGHLTAASPSFVSSLDASHRVRLQVALVKLFKGGDDEIDKVRAASAIALLSEVCDGSAQPLRHIRAADLRAALAELLLDPSALPRHKADAIDCLTIFHRVHGPSFLSSLLSSFPEVRDHLPAELLGARAPPAAEAKVPPSTAAATVPPATTPSPVPAVPPAASPPPPSPLSAEVSAADISLLARMEDPPRSSSSPASSDSLDLIPMLSGLKDAPLLPLPEAVAPIESQCPEVIRFAKGCVRSAKQRLAKPEVKASPYGQLSVDEAGAIMLYTEQFEPVSLFTVLNETLRNNQDPVSRKQRLKPLLPYLKLLLKGLRKLPPAPASLLFRGIRPGDGEDLYTLYKTRQEQGLSVSWWGFTSTTRRLQVLENAMFCGGAGSRVMFTIAECKCGVDIRGLSSFAKEDEVVLPPGVEFEIVDVARGATADRDLVQICLRVVDDGRDRIGEVE